MTAGEAGELPLQGITVVALEQAVAGPLASRHLADLGARVIKLERPGEGDFARHYDHAVHGLATHFVWLNRGKESFEVDLKSPDGQRFVRCPARAGGRVPAQHRARGRRTARAGRRDTARRATRG